MKKTQEQIHYNMQRVKSKDSEIEKILRNALWNKGTAIEKTLKMFSDTPILFLNRKKLLYFVIVNFGTVTIGNVKRMR